MLPAAEPPWRQQQDALSAAEKSMGVLACSPLGAEYGEAAPQPVGADLGAADDVFLKDSHRFMDDEVCMRSGIRLFACAGGWGWGLGGRCQDGQ